MLYLKKGVVFMGEYAQKAQELFYEGYNCAQAVLGAFAERAGISFETAVKTASSFGGGMGGMREVCGAVSGMLMAAGLIFGYEKPNDRAAKSEHYARVRKLSEQFREENGSIICRELLGMAGQKGSQEPAERTEEYYKKRPCPELVAMAAAVLEDYLEKNAG